jgi:hypothetical protein
MRALLSAVLLLSLGVVPATMARNLSEYQRILIPIYVENQPGAYGSLWSSRLSMMLSTPDLIEIGPLRPLCEAPCLPPPIPLNHPFAPQLFVAPGSPGTERHVPVLAQTVDIDGFDIAPGYFEARLEEITGEDLVEGPYWLEIEPLSDVALWGFVSITNNHTNEFSIVLPE